MDGEWSIVHARSPDSQASITRAVVVGISNYQDVTIPDLRFADKEAEAFANFLCSPAGSSLDGHHFKLPLSKHSYLSRQKIDS